MSGQDEMGWDAGKHTKANETAQQNFGGLDCDNSGIDVGAF